MHILPDRELPEPLRAGTPAFRRTSLAIFAGGFGTFVLLYCPQAILPLLAESFDVGPAASSLALSLSTGALALMIVVAGSLAESFGRKRVMTWSLLAAALLSLGCAFTQGFVQLLVLRLLVGVALSGLPACIMAYVGEEVAPDSVGYAIGLSIGGNAFGGMMGRVATGIVADRLGWRWGLGLAGAVGIVCALIFWRALPESRRFVPQPLRLGSLALGLGRHFAEPALRWLFLTPFLLMGAFVTMYNYVGFRLEGPPFGLSQGAIGALFMVYVAGIATSAWAGRMADRFGRRKTLWVGIAVALCGGLLTGSGSLAMLVVGVAVLTMGFFGAHAIASSWVTRRARMARAQASALYLFFYYAGSSLIGTFGGLVYARAGWTGIVALLTILHVAALGVALRLSFIPPLPENVR